jgi:hypothetical protein
MRGKRLGQILVIIVLTISFFCEYIFAEEDTATLSLMIGTVRFCPHGTEKWEDAIEGMKLSTGDRVRTGSDGMLSILFSNGSLVTLKPNTEFKIESLNISEDKADIDYRLELTLGRLRAIVEKLDDESSFEIKTPTAVAAVRGTIYYLYVREVADDEVPPDVKERLVTELFVEEGGVIYTNTFSGRRYTVRAEHSSRAYGDGTIEIPIEVPEDKQLEWTEGWEDILAAEPYELPEDTTIADITGLDAEGEIEDTESDRQSDQSNQLQDDDSFLRELINRALEASENANEAAIRAHQARDDALTASEEIDTKKKELEHKKEDMNLLYDETITLIDDASASYATANTKTQEAEQALNEATDNVGEETKKNTGYIIVDINALNNQLTDLDTQFANISEDVEDFNDILENLRMSLFNSGDPNITVRLQEASEQADFWANQAQDLATQLREAATKAHIEGNDAALEVLNVLIEVTQQAINRADRAAIAANLAAADAEHLLADAAGTLVQVDEVIDALNSIINDIGEVKTDLDNAIAYVENLINNTDEIKEDLQLLIANQLQHEKDVIWQQICDRILLAEREFLRQEIGEILNDNRNRRMEGYIEKISDAQMGKVLRDIHGNRVRVEQYVLRPASNIVELLNVNLRGGDDLTTMEWITKFNTSLDDLPTGQLKTLPWSRYLDTKVGGRAGFYIKNPQPDNVYPEEMSVTFSHDIDSFTEKKSFSEPKYKNPHYYTDNGKLWIQEIHDMQLLVKNFNNNQPMNYKSDPFETPSAGTYLIVPYQRNAEIGGATNNPKGFKYKFASHAGEQNSINAAFYVVSDNGMRQDGYSSLKIKDIWDALRINMIGSSKNIGDNNLEMIFSSAVLRYGPIDILYVPHTRMEWKGDSHIPDYSLPN